MRPTLWLTLLACCFVGFVLRAASTDLAARPPGPAVANGRNGVARVDTIVYPTAQAAVFTTSAEGFGTTDELARKDALKIACDRVAGYLADQYNETNYKPSPEFLQRLNILPPADDIAVTSGTVPNMPEMKAATVQVRVTDDSAKKLRDQARQERVTQRQHSAGLGLAGFVALLLVGAGYLRLEEATKGYYTGLLRLSALGLLGMAAGAIWYVS